MEGKLCFEQILDRTALVEVTEERPGIDDLTAILS